MGFTATGFASKGTKTIVNVTAFKALCSAMAVRPRSKTELHELTGLTNTTISRWMNVLSAGKDRIVFIAEWKRVGKAGCQTAFWSLGYGMPDAVKPKALTGAQYSKRRRIKAAKAEATVSQTPTGLIHQAGFQLTAPQVKPFTYSVKHGVLK